MLPYELHRLVKTAAARNIIVGGSKGAEESSSLVVHQTLEALSMKS